MRVEMQGRTPIKLWTTSPRGEVPVEAKALEQLRNIARLPFVFRHVAAMPDVHLGIGATVGSVIATRGAIVPAAVGVDLGCGMEAVRTSLTASDLPDSLHDVRSAIEAAVPHGRTHHGGPGDRGAWGEPPKPVAELWQRLGRDERYRRLVEQPPEGRPERRARPPPRHARHRQPLHRALPRRGRARLADAAQRQPRDRQPHRQLLHRAREAGARALRRAAARPRPRVPAGVVEAVRGVRRGGRLGAGLRGRQPRGDAARHDGRHRERARAAARGRRRGGDLLPPQLRGARAALRRGRARRRARAP